MAITIPLDRAAGAFLTFERPAYIGGCRSGVRVYGGSYDHDTFGYTIIGTRPDGYVVQSGDYLNYQIYPVSSGNGTLIGGIDLKFVGGPFLSDKPALDTEGRPAASYDWAPYIGEWVQVQQSLEDYVGMAIDALAFTCDENVADADPALNFSFRYKQIVITNGEAVVKSFFVGQSTGLPSEADWLENGSPVNSTLVLQVEAAGGTVPGAPTIVNSGTSYSVQADETIIINTSSAGAMTFNLPDVTLLPDGKYYIFTNAHASNNLVIDPFSTQTILTSAGSQSTITLTPGQSLEIIKNSGAWVKIGGA